MHLDSSVAYTDFLISVLDLMPGCNPADKIYGKKNKKISPPLLTFRPDL